VKALRFNVTVPGFLIARSLGRVTESAVFGRLSGLRLTQVAETLLPGSSWASLRVLGCGICGSDLGNLSYESSPSMEPFGSFPATLGHEILAVVESVGSGVSRVAPGDRVAIDPMLSCGVRGHSGEAVCPSCRAGRHGTCEMAGEEGALTLAGGRALGPGLTIGYHRDLPGGWGERMVAHESQLFRLDPRVSSRAAVLMEPLSIGVHAVLNAPPTRNDRVLVIGSGPIALGTIWALRATGFGGTVIAQTKRAHEAALASALGASEVVAPGVEAREALVATGAHAYQPIVGDEVFAGGGFTKVFDCVGSRSSVDQSLRYASPRATVVLLGCAGELRRLDLSFLWSRELNVRGFVAYGVEDWRGARRHTMEVTQELILESGAPLERLVTHVFPLSQYRDALSVAANHGRHEAIRVVLTPRESGLP